MAFDWKEFLRPSWSKLLISIVLAFALLPFIDYFVLGHQSTCGPGGSMECTGHFDFTTNYYGLFIPGYVSNLLNSVVFVVSHPAYIVRDGAYIADSLLIPLTTAAVLYAAISAATMFFSKSQKKRK